ncbi:MAG: heavy-metal-associated domain-containing protein [Candidatus Igneacidithiobacillus chanchocoensis]
MATIELKVEGMTCEHCVRAATTALRAVPGVEKIEVRLPDFACVEGSAGLDALQAALREEGYTAEQR